MFFHLLHVSLANGYILYKKDENPGDYNSFYESIIRALLGSKKQEKNNKSEHDIQYISTDYDNRHKQMRCIVCKTGRTIYMCSKCLNGKAFLCIPNCYNNFHYNK